MKDQHRLARLLKELENAFVVEADQLQQAFRLLKQLDRRERRRLLERFEQLVGRSGIAVVITGPVHLGVMAALQAARGGCDPHGPDHPLVAQRLRALD